MERKHPKRKKDQQNNYKLEITENNGYLLSFTDGEGVIQKLNISEELYELFNLFELEDISYMNEISRHYEHSELTEEIINQKALYKIEPLDNYIEKRVNHLLLNRAIEKLPEIQRRRLTLYYFNDMTYDEIACIEKCSKGAVKKSISIAKRKIKSQLKNTIL